MFGSNTSQTSGGAVDPQFNYVTMLLHGDGTNGAQNNTFVDSSSNNFTITRNGNTTQGSFSPYGSLWSNYFDGSGDSLVIANNSALNFGTGDFTIEFWINTTQVSADVFNKNQNLAGSYEIYTNSSGTIYLSAGSNVPVTSTSNVCNGAWHHVVMVRSGTDLALFVDGSRQATATSTYDYTSSDSLTIGAFSTGANPFRGYLSNVRFVKGTAVYSPTSSTLTVPTTPLTAITNTSLLTCQSNRFIDNSTNNFTITRNGDVSVQRFSPFAPSAAYSTATVGGSGYFDGSGDYLTVPSNTAFNLGSGDFTIECWWYPTNFNNDSEILNATGSGGTLRNFSIYSYGNNGTVACYAGTGGSSWDIVSQLATGTAIKNAWNHIAFTRSGSTFATFLNGTRISTTTASGTLGLTANLGIGANQSGGGGIPSSFISDCRIVKGTALYTASTYTVPTSPLTAVSGTGVLTNFTNAAIFDNAMMCDLETVGNAQISTSVKKYGTGSLYFDGTGDYLNQRGSNLTDLAQGGDFTVEAWVNPASYADIRTIASVWQQNSTNDQWIFALNTAGALTFWWAPFSAGGPLLSGGTVSQNVWTHVAVTKNGSTFKAFVNGTEVSSAANSSTGGGTADMRVGYYGSGIGGSATSYWNGYIDDLRITKGYARYTATFTPPAQAFPNQ